MNKVKCVNCNNMILPSTAQANAGKCAVCAKPKPPPDVPDNFTTLVEIRSYLKSNHYELHYAEESIRVLIYNHYSAEQLESETKVVQMAYASLYLESEIFNGGMAQAFYNCKDLFPLALAAYQSYGFTMTSDVIKKAIDRFDEESQLLIKLGLIKKPSLTKLQKYFSESSLAQLDQTFYAAIDKENRGQRMQSILQ